MQSAWRVRDGARIIELGSRSVFQPEPPEAFCVRIDAAGVPAGWATFATEAQGHTVALEWEMTIGGRLAARRVYDARVTSPDRLVLLGPHAD